MKIKQAVNPYMPSWEYVPDAEPHVVGDRVYAVSYTHLTLPTICSV